MMKCKASILHVVVIIVQWSKYVIMANVFFGLLAAFHLAYLGLMFDSSSQQEEVCVLSTTFLSSFIAYRQVLVKW